LYALVLKLAPLAQVLVAAAAGIIPAYPYMPISPAPARLAPVVAAIFAEAIDIDDAPDAAVPDV
jgi:hypothetical protein